MVTWHLTIDCADPARMVAFWGPALGYEVPPPPEGHATWNDWYRSVGVPDEELDPNGDGADRLHDPAGCGPRIWFQQVPEPKQVKNRFHLDLDPTGPDPRSLPIERRREIVETAVAERLAAGATVLRRNDDHGGYAVLMADPEGNEFCVS
ncbi:VOC family protein [Nocardioides sp. GCM10027113]|uniref:VOC family protein n=1 Tax=unclassified Nocardioides TaxID=2615069 RepID=UPI0036170E03